MQISTELISPCNAEQLKYYISVLGGLQLICSPGAAQRHWHTPVSLALSEWGCTRHTRLHNQKIL